jgi:hypothetical protein
MMGGHVRVPTLDAAAVAPAAMHILSAHDASAAGPGRKEI